MWLDCYLLINFFQIMYSFTKVHYCKHLLHERNKKINVQWNKHVISVKWKPTKHEWQIIKQKKTNQATREKAKMECNAKEETEREKKTHRKRWKWWMWQLTILEHLLDLRSCQCRRCHQFWILFRLDNHIHGQHPPDICSIYGNLLGGHDARMNQHLILRLVLGKWIRWLLLQYFQKNNFLIFFSLLSFFRFFMVFFSFSRFFSFPNCSKKNYCIEKATKFYLHFYILELDRPTCRHELHDHKPIQVNIDNGLLHRSSNSRKHRIYFHRQRYRTSGNNVLLK